MFNWSEFGEVADDLAHNQRLAKGSPEAHWRTAISRAYYAAYHAALNAAQQREPAAINVSDTKHETLIGWYKGTNDPQTLVIGSLLDTLKKYRVAADYHASTPIKQLKAQASVDLAKKIAQQVKRLGDS